MCNGSSRLVTEHEAGGSEWAVLGCLEVGINFVGWFWVDDSRRAFVMRTKCKSLIIKLVWEFHNSYAKQDQPCKFVPTFRGFFNVLLVWCAHMPLWGWVYHGACVEVREQLCGASSLLPPLWGLWVVEVRSTGLYSKYLYLLSHPTSPWFLFNDMCCSLGIRNAAFVTQHLVSKSRF